jgi:CubicO group peptidase (beta-lactamase class C family)
MSSSRVLSVCLLLAAGCGGADLPAAGDHAGWSDWLDEHVPPLMREHGVPGVAIAYSGPDGPPGFRAYGIADRHGTEVTSETTFRAASVSKTATALGVLRLVDEGLVALDEPVSLDGWEPPPGVTPRDLLRHTAGLGVPTVESFLGGEQLPSLQDALARVEQVGPAGEVRYSGGGYEVLQLLIEETTGTRFDRWMAREVLAPLGMPRSSMSGSPDAEGYDARGGRVPDYSYVGQAAAGLVTNAPELMRMVDAVLDDDRMHRPEAWAKEGGVWGLGVGVDERSGTPVIGHTGQDLGWGAKWLAIPSEGVGFVVLTNSDAGIDVTVEISCSWTGWALGISARHACP